ncbi:hypothetical protein ENUP19_0315G0012 [Entamoeba nuttalli]|uniref:lysozyme n=2 Tax=Entamoeba nuttalli TaxID=412467 RepID=K2GZK3_ENTNP|nr:lysozyme, putative [Entamoeba nuttalli P19]EKE40623.1 lysozyme, putative [Entamoeba nuttalli P19]|eukprot:XP_008857041.1 lysozyme, putative [Entamoeba nuttalli P19]
MLFILAAIVLTAHAASYGVDIAESISTSSIKCLRDLGFNSFFIFRAWRSLGSFDPNAKSINENALAAGFSAKHIDAYFYPCFSCGDPAGQVKSFWNQVTSKKLKFERLWFDIEGTWSSSKSSNRKFFESLTNEAAAIGIKSGIYASYYNWEDIVGLDYKFSRAGSWPIWYPHYDGKKTFSDFKSFGGWTSPYMKQYNGDMTACSHDVDYNYRP